MDTAFLFEETLPHPTPLYTVVSCEKQTAHAHLLNDEGVNGQRVSATWIFLEAKQKHPKFWNLLLMVQKSGGSTSWYDKYLLHYYLRRVSYMLGGWEWDF